MSLADGHFRFLPTIPEPVTRPFFVTRNLPEEFLRF